MAKELQDKAFDEKETLICSKDRVCKFYSHLLDLVNTKSLDSHYSEWCDLESEYISIFGEEVFSDYFKQQNQETSESWKIEKEEIIKELDCLVRKLRG